MATSAMWADSDDDLVSRVRDGAVEAYDVLYERYAGRARRVARAVLDQATDVDDVVSEAFAAVLGALHRGKGPTEGFAGYLISAVRHEAYRMNRRHNHQRPLGDETNELTADPFAGREDADVLRAAFSSLPTVARDVLWRTEVEGHSHADIARSVGSTAQAIAARAARARDALGGAYLAGHLDLAFDEPPTTPECSEIRGHLVDLVRGNASWRRRRAVEGHLAGCARCRSGRDRLERLNERLRTAPFMAAASATARLTAAHGATFAARLTSIVSQPIAGAVVATALTAAAMMAPSFGEAGSRDKADPPAATASTRSSRPTRQGRAEAASGSPVAAPVSATGASARGEALGPPGVAEIPADPMPLGSGSVAGVTVPASTVPPDTMPAAVTTVPPLVLPVVTLPPTSLPAVTVPPLTVPAVDVPPLALPLITTPPITTPAITTPEIPTPAITTPPIATPAITIPAVTLPSITTPSLPGL